MGKFTKMDQQLLNQSDTDKISASSPEINIQKKETETEDIKYVTPEEIETPSGRKAIILTLPESNKTVIIVKPSTQNLIDIERLIMNKYINAGDFEKSIVTLSKLIVQFDDSKGDNCVKISQLISLEPEDIAALNQASQSFFRSVGMG